MAISKIEWTEATWNPVTGCTKTSPGCANCYAERMTRRLQAMGHPNYVHGFEPAWHECALELPLSWHKPKMIFVNSMSDLFHEAIPFGFIEAVFQTMCKAKQHRFQILTKRSERLAEIADDLPWPENIWMGVSIENRDYLHRLDNLCRSDAKIRFVSMEPLLGPMGRFCVDNIDWVIVGGESGPRARTMSYQWVVEIRDQCVNAGVPFFFKQWGGFRKKASGRLLDGRTWDEIPCCDYVR